MTDELKPSSAADVKISIPAEPQPAAATTPTAAPTPTAAAHRNPKPSRVPMLLIAFGVCGLGTLMVLASSMRSPAPPAATTTTRPATAPPPAPATKTAHAVAPATQQPPATDAPVAVTSNRPAPLWRIKRAYLRGRDVVTFELPADQDVPVWQSLVRPVLTIRCERKTSEVFVMTYTPSSFERARQHTVKLSFDGGSELAQEWEHSVNHDALFAPEKNDLARHIADADRLSFTFTPFNAPPAVATFTVGGFNEQVTPALQRACGWTPSPSANPQP